MLWFVPGHFRPCQNANYKSTPQKMNWWWWWWWWGSYCIQISIGVENTHTVVYSHIILPHLFLHFYTDCLKNICPLFSLMNAPYTVRQSTWHWNKLLTFQFQELHQDLHRRRKKKTWWIISTICHLGVLMLNNVVSPIAIHWLWIRHNAGVSKALPTKRHLL